MPATLSVELYVGLWRWWQSHYGPWLLPLRVTKIAGVNLMVNGVVCLTLFVWWIIQFHVKLDDLCFYNFVAAHGLQNYEQGTVVESRRGIRVPK